MITSADVEKTPIVQTGSGPLFDETVFWRFAALQYAGDQARRNAGTTPISNLTVNSTILMWLQKPEFWNSGGGTLKQSFWTTVYTPAPWEGLGGQAAADVAQLSGNFEVIVGSNASRYAQPSPGPFGDLDHWAATTRGYLTWGIPPNGQTDAHESEFGGWGIDLVRVWAAYESARLKLGYTSGIYQFTYDTVGHGVDGINEFSQADLLADLAAFCIASKIQVDSSRTLSDAVRVVSNEMYADPGYLAKYFLQQRFNGSHTTLKSAAQSMFTRPFPFNLGVDNFMEGARPPEGTKDPATDPSAGTRATELQDLARGFSDAIDVATTWLGW